MKISKLDKACVLMLVACLVVWAVAVVATKPQAPPETSPSTEQSQELTPEQLAYGAGYRYTPSWLRPYPPPLPPTGEQT